MKKTPTAISGSAASERELLPAALHERQQRPRAPEAGREIHAEADRVKLRSAGTAEMDAEVRVGDVSRKHERPAAANFAQCRSGEVDAEHDEAPSSRLSILAA